MLDGFAVAASPGGNRLGRFALQVAELALEDDAGQFLLLDAVEAWQVALQEVLQPSAATLNGVRRDLGIGQQGLGGGVFEQGHPSRSCTWSSSERPQPVAYLLRKTVTVQLQKRRTPLSQIAAAPRP